MWRIAERVLYMAVQMCPVPCGATRACGPCKQAQHIHDRLYWWAGQCNTRETHGYRGGAGGQSLQPQHRTLVRIIIWFLNHHVETSLAYSDTYYQATS